MVVKKFWTAVPECCFVLVPLEDELFSPSQSIALPEVLRYPANKKIRPPSRSFKYPSQHRRRCSLPVGAAHDDGMLPRQKYLFQNFRQCAVRNLPIENFFQLGVSTRDDIANDRQIRRGLHVRGVERLEERDT